MKNLFASLSVLLLAACADQVAEISPAGNKTLDFAVPAALVDKTVDLNNKEDVADALGIKLTGDPKQKLYDIAMTAPSTSGVKTRTIPIRVDNIKQGSEIIYSIEGSHSVAKKRKRQS